MNIHVNISRFYFEIEEIRHLFTSRHQLFVGIHDSLMEIRMTHITTIHKEVLTCSFLARSLRTTNKARNTYHSCIHIHRKQFLIDFLTENTHNTLLQLNGGKVQHLRPIMVKGKGYIRINQSYTLKLCKDIT